MLTSKLRVDDLTGHTPAEEVPYVAIADVVDEIYSQHLSSALPRLTVSMDMYQYTSAPHQLEPIDLLTIEAYNTRYLHPNRINFSGSDVLPKVLYRISGEDIERGYAGDVLGELDASSYQAHQGFSSTQTWLANCCSDKGCSYPADGSVCSKLSGAHAGGQGKMGVFDSRQVTSGSKHWLRVHKYSRSLEKYQFQQNSALPGSNIHDLRVYMNKAYGWHFDPIALIYSCLVRFEINEQYNKLAYNPTLVIAKKDLDSDSAKRQRTPSYYFLRSGDSWYRNPEFGRPIMDLSRRGRGTGGAAAYIRTPYNPTTVGNIYTEHNNGRSHRFYTVYESIMQCKV